MSEQLGDATRPVRAAEEDALREGDASRLRRVGRWLGMVARRGESKDGDFVMGRNGRSRRTAEQHANGHDGNVVNGNGSNGHLNGNEHTVVTPELLEKARQALLAEVERTSPPPGVLEVGPQRPLDHRLWGPGIVDLLRPGTIHSISDDEWRANRQKTIESMVAHSRVDRSPS